MTNKHTYSTSDLNELTKELQRLRAEGYFVVKGPEFSENEYHVELEREASEIAVVEAVVVEKPVEAVSSEPAADKPAEPKPAHKQRGPKPKKSAE